MAEESAEVAAVTSDTSAGAADEVQAYEWPDPLDKTRWEKAIKFAQDHFGSIPPLQRANDADISNAEDIVKLKIPCGVDFWLYLHAAVPELQFWLLRQVSGSPRFAKVMNLEILTQYPGAGFNFALQSFRLNSNLDPKTSVAIWSKAEKKPVHAEWFARKNTREKRFVFSCPSLYIIVFR